MSLYSAYPNKTNAQTTTSTVCAWGSVSMEGGTVWWHSPGYSPLAWLTPTGADSVCISINPPRPATPSMTAAGLPRLQAEASIFVRPLDPTRLFVFAPPG